MADEERDQQFVEFVLKNIVDNPDDVRVDRTIDEMGVLISVTVNPDDMGKVIGKSGQTAKAIRTLLKVVGAKNDARVNMKIIEPEGGTGGADAGTTGTDDIGGPADQPAPGSTDAADDVPADDTANIEEAAAEQTQSDAAAPQPNENDEAVDEATGQPQPQEPVTAEEAGVPASEEPADETPDTLPPNERPAEEPPRRDFDERSPLDEL